MEDKGNPKFKRQMRNAPKRRRTAIDENTGLLLEERSLKTTEMTRNKALNLLGLHGFPLHGAIHEAARALLLKHSPEMGGNPRKYQVITGATSILMKDQDRIMRQFGQDMEMLHRAYQTNMQTFYDKYGTHKYYDSQGIIDYISGLGTKMQNLNRSYLEDLKRKDLSAADFKKTEADYYKAYHKLLDSVNDHHEIDITDRSLIQKELRALYLDPTTCDAHLPYGYKIEAEVSINPLEAFKDQFKYYLSDILAMKSEYTHHQQTFTDLHDKLQEIGTQYINALKDPNKDVEQVSQEYAQQFQEAIKIAKAEFSQEPGIWQNLGPILKGLFTVLFFIKYFISLAETEVDKNRMYQPEQHSIQDKWERWEMDVMPEIDVQARSTFKHEGN